jgi:two-component system response regulator YesN
MKRIRQQDCAKLFHFNKDYMCRRFKEEYGVGMVNYLTQVRINHAKSFLLDTDMQYQEIADAVGIFDSKYFAKLFKRETGQTPAEFRQQRRKSVK